MQPTSAIQNQPQEAWHQLDAAEVEKRLATSHDQGLSEQEVKARLEKYGYNQLDEAPPTSFLAMLWEQFNNFVVWLLLAAAGISGFLGEWLESGAILAIVVLNAGFGIMQERRAGKTYSKKLLRERRIHETCA
ncbi:MAG: cation-transporting P-type ATPase [Anaerolineales bacterium]